MTSLTFCKRGILINLEQHWREINILNLLQHRYGCGISVDAHHCIPPSPYWPLYCILLAYDQLCCSLAGKVHSSDLWNLSSDFDIIRCFDHYSQEIHTKGCPDPNVEFNDDWSYFFVDIQGWSH